MKAAWILSRFEAAVDGAVSSRKFKICSIAKTGTSSSCRTLYRALHCCPGVGRSKLRRHNSNQLSKQSMFLAIRLCNPVESESRIKFSRL